MNNRESQLETAFYLRNFMLDLQGGALNTRRFAASVLRDYADVRTLRTLIGALADADEEVRRLACEGVEAIFEGETTQNDIVLPVASEAMQLAGQIYRKRSDPLMLRLFDLAITSQNANIALAADEMLRTFPCQELASLAQLQDDAVAQAAWRALRWHYEQSQRATVDLFIAIVLSENIDSMRGKPAEKAQDSLVTAVRSVIEEAPAPLQIAECTRLFGFVASNDAFLVKVGWASLTSVFATSSNGIEYEQAFKWVYQHFEEWTRWCSTDDPAAQQVIGRLLQSDSFFHGWSGLDADKLRLWAALTHPSEPFAESAWNLLVYNFNGDQHYNATATVVMMELAVGKIRGNSEAAKDFLAINPLCLVAAESSAWLALQDETDIWVTEFLVKLLAHERKEVQNNAFEKLCSRQVPHDLLPPLITYASEISALEPLIAQYGATLCWEVLRERFTRNIHCSDPTTLSLFGDMRRIEEGKTLHLLFRMIASESKDRSQEACHILFSQCHHFTEFQSKIAIDGALLILESCDMELQIWDSVKQWHQEFLGSLDLSAWSEVPRECLCRFILLTDYGTDAQKVLTLNKILSDNPRTNAILLKRCLEWKKRQELIVPVQRIENYLMGLRAAGQHPTPTAELLQGAEAPIETKPERSTGFLGLFK